MTKATFNLVKFKNDKAYKDNWLNTVKGMNVKRLYIKIMTQSALTIAMEVHFSDDITGKFIPFNIINTVIDKFCKTSHF